MKSLSVSIQINAIEQYFSVVLFITLYKLTVTLDTARNTLLQ